MAKTLTGNRVNILIDGEIIGGGIQSVGMDTDYGLQDVDGIGSPLPFEHVVGKTVHSITLDKYVLSKQNLISKGFAPNDEKLLTQDILDIEVINNDGEVEMIYQGCSCANHRVTITKHAIVGENSTFRALNLIVP